MAKNLFVLGTGRCGTNMFAHLMDGVSDCHIAHEANPLLLKEITDYRNGVMSRADMVDLLRRTRGEEALGGSRLSGESNQRLSLIMPELHEAFPNAKFIWLIRDGRDFGISALERLWYSPREAEVPLPHMAEWSEHRVRADQVGEMSAAQWNRLEPLGRNFWYWSYINRLIEKESKRLNLPMFLLRLEDAKTRVNEMMQFLELEAPKKMEVPVTNQSRKKIRKSATWQQWSPRHRAMFTELCGSEMDKHYPGWRESMKFSVGQEMTAMLARSWRTGYAIATDVSRPLRRALKGNKTVVAATAKG
jgi:hypothetical protein